MTAKIAVKRVDTIPEGAQVCHYDELAESAKAQLPRLAEAEGLPLDVDADIACGFQDCDLIKFTDYYQVEQF